MFIWKDTQKRCNPSAKYTAPDGTRYTKVPVDLYEEIADPVPPTDYSDETYYRTEQDEAPYVVFTKKSDEQLAEIRKSKLLAEIASKESATMLPRVTREFMLTFMEMNGTPEQLALNIGYTKVKALDDEVKALRGQL